MVMDLAKYTTEIRSIVENNYQLDMKRYPIFDESYRDHLNGKIIDHYFFREIGFETVALFKHFLNVRLNEIMPYYNQLYLSEKLITQPLINKSYKEIYDKKREDDTTQNSSLKNVIDYDRKRDIIETENKTVDIVGDSAEVMTGNKKVDSTGNIVDVGSTSNNSMTDSVNEKMGNVKTDNTTTDNATNESNVNVNATTASTLGNTVVQSDTPQAVLSMADITKNLYASKADITNGNNDGTSTSKTDTKGKNDNINVLEGNENTTINDTGKVTVESSTSSTNNNDSKNELNEDVKNETDINFTTNEKDVTTNDTADTIVDKKEENGTTDAVLNAKGWENFVRSLSGFDNKTESIMLNEYRTTFLNIDNLVINDLSNLFLNLW